MPQPLINCTLDVLLIIALLAKDCHSFSENGILSKGSSWLFENKMLFSNNQAEPFDNILFSENE